MLLPTSLPDAESKAMSDITNPKDAIGQHKPPLCLVPASANILEATVFALGAKKYGSAFNWRKQNVGASTYVSAALRHLSQWFDGENDDAESGVSHLAHARACLGILIDASVCGSLVDDRPPVGASSKLIQELTVSNKEHGDAS
jgi:hypothetical protein